MNDKTTKPRATRPPRIEEVSDSVRAALLGIAAKEFASQGYAGARLEKIASDAGITRAMIYYYFGGREGLYVAVLEDAYNAIWCAEHRVKVEGVSPLDALRELVRFRVSYYIENPVFVALVAVENQQQAQHLKQSQKVVSSAAPSLQHTALVLKQGQDAGVFRKDIDVVDLYQVIVSLGFFNVSNRNTFGAIFHRSFSDVQHVCAFVCDVVLRYVLVDPNTSLTKAPRTRSKP
jgi:AcrR family transcriptional regulator